MIKYVYCLRKRADLTDEESPRVYRSSVTLMRYN